MLSMEEALRRIDQFVAEGLPLIVTRAPLFTNKAEILNDCKFVVVGARIPLPVL